MGSGSLAAIAVFEDKFRPDMEEEEAKKLVSEAIAAGVFNDLGSGSNIDLCVISKSKLTSSARTRCPTRRGLGLAGTDVRKGPPQSSLKKSPPWRLRCWKKQFRQWTLREWHLWMDGYCSTRLGCGGTVEAPPQTFIWQCLLNETQ